MRTAVAVVATCVWLGASPARGQDLFELEVFPAALTASKETEIELHANGLPGRAAPRGVDAVDHPLHASLEIGHGWTDRFELSVFVQTAPIAHGGLSPFAGGHVRPKFSIPLPQRTPIDVSFAVEYGFNRTPFDENRQTLEFVPIVERRANRLTLTANPKWSMVVRGPESGEPPKLSFAGKVAWQSTRTIAASAEYYWKSEALKHFNPDSERHHLLMPAMDLKLSDDWALNLAAGHCLTDEGERWVLKTVVGYRFR